MLQSLLHRMARMTELPRCLPLTQTLILNTFSYRLVIRHRQHPFHLPDKADRSKKDNQPIKQVHSVALLYSLFSTTPGAVLHARYHSGMRNTPS